MTTTRPATDPPAADPPASDPDARVRELAWTSYARVVAIIAVAFIHVAGYTYANPALEGTGTWHVAALLTFSTKWAVPVFVMVSGALLLKPPRDRSPMTFYRRRLSRIGIPLVFWHLVYIGILFYQSEGSPNLRKLAASLLRGEVYTAMYFFWLILGLYVVTPLIWPVIDAFSTNALTVVALGITALPAAELTLQRVIPLLAGSSSLATGPTVVTQFLPWVGFFLLGYVLKDVVVRGARLVALAVATFVICLGFTLQVTVLPQLPAPLPKAVNTLVPLSYQGWLLALGSIGVYLLCRSIVSPTSRLAAPAIAGRVRHLGNLTLGVFACHLLVLFVALRVLDLPKGATTLGMLLALNVGVVVVSFVVSEILNRLPLLRRTV
ncbi:acyltransferase [Knoellia sp. LjRoot47]|uniref:acyltransferase n=1 Tax=Knoellia sp. LjRoot47 TaxID=3342330 RepID=UPI003ED0FB6C